ncbi:hypothetical protein J6590_026419 [Homalodisca vitripennis]|nr:hypothetical protein J6590_026419 [Homalodisca vitripennis]
MPPCGASTQDIYSQCHRSRYNTLHCDCTLYPGYSGVQCSLVGHPGHPFRVPSIAWCAVFVSGPPRTSIQSAIDRGIKHSTVTAPFTRAIVLCSVRQWATQDIHSECHRSRYNTLHCDCTLYPGYSVVQCSSVGHPGHPFRVPSIAWATQDIHSECHRSRYNTLHCDCTLYPGYSGVQCSSVGHQDIHSECHRSRYNTLHCDCTLYPGYSGVQCSLVGHPGHPFRVPSIAV